MSAFSSPVPRELPSCRFTPNLQDGSCPGTALESPEQCSTKASTILLLSNRSRPRGRVGVELGPALGWLGPAGDVCLSPASMNWVPIYPETCCTQRMTPTTPSPDCQLNMHIDLFWSLIPSSPRSTFSLSSLSLRSICLSVVLRDLPFVLIDASSQVQFCH